MKGEGQAKRKERGHIVQFFVRCAEVSGGSVSVVLEEEESLNVVLAIHVHGPWWKDAFR